MSDKSEMIQAMGLTPQDEADEVVRFGRYDRKTELHEAVKLTDTGLIDAGNLWRKTEATPQTNQVSCKIPVWIAKVSAVIAAGEADGVTDKVIPAMYYLCKEETSKWAKQHLKFYTKTDKHKARLMSTAPESSYDVNNYQNLIL